MVIRFLILLLFAWGCCAYPPYTTRYTDYFLRFGTDAETARELLDMTNYTVVYNITTNSYAVTTNVFYYTNSAVQGVDIVHLSARTDGEPGNGSAGDPYDASTSVKLHALWDAGLNSTVVFQPGNYYTTKTLSASGKTVFGYGATLYYSNSVTSGNGFFLPARLEGITLDMGTYVTSATTVNNAVYCSSNAKIRNVSVTHMEGDTGTTEGFGIIGFGNNILVEGCSVTNPDGDYVSAIAMGNGSGHRILNNLVDMGSTSKDDLLFGISTYADNCVVSGNVVQNVANAVHHDNSGSTPADGAWNSNTYSGNYLDGTFRTIRFDTTAQRYQGWNFTGNTIRSDHTWVFLQGTTPTNCADFIFTGNLFTGGATNSDNIVNAAAGTSGLKLTGNTWDSSVAISDTNNYTGFDTLYMSNGVLYAVGPNYTNSI